MPENILDTSPCSVIGTGSVLASALIGKHGSPAHGDK